MCAGKLDMQIPAGDDHWRLVCTACGYIDFLNPKMVRASAVSTFKPVMFVQQYGNTGNPATGVLLLQCAHASSDPMYQC